MRLLLDMGVSPRTATFLRGHGHDALHLRELGLQALSDQGVMLRAVEEHRGVVTFDLDFPRILAVGRLASPSIVLLRLVKFTTDQVNALLLRVLSRCSDRLDRGAVVVVDLGRIRIRDLPIFGGRKKDQG